MQTRAPLFLAAPRLLSCSALLAFHLAVFAISRQWSVQFGVVFTHQMRNERFNQLVARFVGFGAYEKALPLPSILPAQRFAPGDPTNHIEGEQAILGER